MANTFQVDVVSPEAIIWSGRATILIARTPEGELGIMADHEPLMGALATGSVEIEDETGARTTIGVQGGFIQVLKNQVTLITDRAQLTERHADANEVAGGLVDEAQADEAQADEAQATEAEDG